MIAETTNSNGINTERMRSAIFEDSRFIEVLHSLITKNKDGVTCSFTQNGAVIFEVIENQESLEKFVEYARSFNDYLEDLMRGKRKPDDQYVFKEGESTGARTKLGKSGAEGQVFNFPPFLVKETRSDFLEKIYTEKYIPFTQLDSLIIMEGLRTDVLKQTAGLVSIPEHYGVVSFRLESSTRLFEKPTVELLIMEKVGDENGTTVEQVETGKAYQEKKSEIIKKAKQAITLLKLFGESLPYGVFRDLGVHNLIVNPEAFEDKTKPLFYLIDQ